MDTLIRSSKVYTLTGEIENIDVDKIYNNIHIFKKMTQYKVELEICKILMKYPHKNIVKIFDIGPDYVIMEQVNIDLSNVCKDVVISKMTELKDYLQNLGIIYIDWKCDNIGIDSNGELKLFDFNISGLVDVHTQKWVIEASHYYAYNRAILDGYTTPIEIDNYAFRTYLLKYCSDNIPKKNEKIYSENFQKISESVCNN